MAGTSEGNSRSPLSLAEAVEEYSAFHPETVDELLRWTATRFDRLFELHQKRLIISGLDEQKRTMIGALWSNSNWDDTKESKGHRQSMINSIESQHQEAVSTIEKALGGAQPLPEEEKIPEDNPFFAASKRGLEKVEKRFAQSGQKVKSDDGPDYMKDLDQG